MESVYCAVRTQYLYTIQDEFGIRTGYVISTDYVRSGMLHQLTMLSCVTPYCSVFLVNNVLIPRPNTTIQI